MKQFLFFLILLSLPAIQIGCNDNGTTATKSETGIEGQVYSIGAPTVPVGWTPPPLERVSTIIIMDTKRQPLTEVLTDEKGKFKVLFAPGIYYLQVKESLLPAETGPFEVKQGVIVSTRANYDNGIR